jgi:hypothetical protein
MARCRLEFLVANEGVRAFSECNSVEVNSETACATGITAPLTEQICLSAEAVAKTLRGNFRMSSGLKNGSTFANAIRKFGGVVGSKANAARRSRSRLVPNFSSSVSFMKRTSDARNCTAAFNFSWSISISLFASQGIGVPFGQEDGDGLRIPSRPRASV